MSFTLPIDSPGCDNWPLRYIGLPHKGRDCSSGVDCWELIVKIYKEQLDIDLDRYSLVDRVRVEIFGKVIDREIKKWKPLDEPKEFCIVALSQGRIYHHVGIWTGLDGGKVIHSVPPSVCAESLSILKAQGYKFKFYE